MGEGVGVMVARVCVGVLAGVLVVLPVSAASATVGAVPVVGASEAEQRAAAAAKRGVARELSWWITGLGVDRSVTVSRGAGVKVCVIDSGIDATHQDLVGVRFEGGTDVSGKGAPDGLKPDTDHGTGMAAYIAGRGSGPGRSQGIIGAAPDATIISVSSSVFGMTQGEVVVKSIRYCLAQGAKVINMSQAGGLDNEKTRAFIEAQEKDVVIVVAAGNDGQTERTAWREAFGALQVGGVTADLQIHPKSNRGIYKKDGLVYGQGNGVCGPFAVKVGEPIPGASPSGGYSKHGGATSGATAVVSG
ncbi:putative peptidase, partial [Austwickia chelonae NBRC 105200]